MRFAVASVIALTLACGSTNAAEEVRSPSTSTSATVVDTGDAPKTQRFPDVVAVEIERQDDGAYTFAVTMSSPYDSPERYADAWRVLAPDGTELGVRVLLHDHANEQPFTRSLHDVEIPPDVPTVEVEGRDQTFGWGGATIDVVVPSG